MTAKPPRRVLFLCTGNSARSIMAEALLSHHGRGRFAGVSAGSRPAGAVNPLTLRVLSEAGIPTAGLRSKSWDEFAAPDAPAVDAVITVCDSAAAEPCPVWPGHPVAAHWSFADPAAVEGDEARRLSAFRETLRLMDRRIRLLLSLPDARLERPEIRAALQRIARDTAE